MNRSGRAAALAHLSFPLAAGDSCPWGDDFHHSPGIDPQSTDSWNAADGPGNKLLQLLLSPFHKLWEARLGLMVPPDAYAPGKSRARTGR